jgi:hypothetical protein
MSMTWNRNWPYDFRLVEVTFDDIWKLYVEYLGDLHFYFGVACPICDRLGPPRVKYVYEVLFKLIGTREFVICSRCIWRLGATLRVGAWVELRFIWVEMIPKVPEHPCILLGFPT